LAQQYCSWNDWRLNQAILGKNPLTSAIRERHFVVLTCALGVTAYGALAAAAASPIGALKVNGGAIGMAHSRPG
jgi:hypothetical protein